MGCDLLVLSCDGKGVIMRHDALRPGTAEAATKATTKLPTRQSRGEKRNRKQMAEVGAVYDATPAPRSPSDILPATEEERTKASPGPAANAKWLTYRPLASRGVKGRWRSGARPGRWPQPGMPPGRTGAGTRWRSSAGSRGRRPLRWGGEGGRQGVRDIHDAEVLRRAFGPSSVPDFQSPVLAA